LVFEIYFELETFIKAITFDTHDFQFQSYLVGNLYLNLFALEDGTKFALISEKLEKDNIIPTSPNISLLLSCIRNECTKPYRHLILQIKSEIVQTHNVVSISILQERKD